MTANRKSQILAALGALLLAACGKSSMSSQGGPAPAPAARLALTTTDGAGTSTTFTATDANAQVSAYRSTAENQTVIQVCGDVGADGDCARIVILTIGGTTAQRYPLNTADTVTQLVYHADAPEAGVVNHYLSSAGTVDVTLIGAAAGEAVKGTFSATLTCNGGCAGDVTVTGSFDVPLGG